MNKTVKRILVVAIILVVAFLIALPKLDFLRADSKAGNPGGAAPAGGGASRGSIPVEVAVVQTGNLIDKIFSTGTIIPNESVELRSEISGKIDRILFKEGDNVKKGQLLIQINNDELQAQQRKLEYTIKLNEDREFRQQRLLEREAISQQEYDIVLTELNTVRAELQALKADIARYSIRAPFDGVIGLRYVSEGSYITPTTQIANLTDITPAKIDFSVPARYSSQLKVNSRVEFRVENSDDLYTGTIYALEPNIDINTRSLRARAVSPNDNRSLRPGMFARIEVTLNEISDAILVPSEAVIPELNGHKVYLVKNGKAELTEVVLGQRGDRQVQITRGLQVGDSLVTGGILQVRPGAQLSVRQVNTRSPETVVAE